MVLNVEVYPNMQQKKSKTTPKGNGSFHQNTSGLLGGITLEVRGIVSEVLDKYFDNSMN